MQYSYFIFFIPLTEVLRNMLNSPSRLRCKSQIESTLRILRDCPVSQNLWRSTRFEYLWRLWFRNGVNFPNSTSYLVGIWWLWRARNAISIDNEDFPLFKLKLTVVDLANLIDASSRSSRNTRTPRKVYWHPSREDCIVLNVDGSSFGNPSRSSFGGLIRIGDGSWIVGFLGHLESTTTCSLNSWRLSRVFV